MRLTINAIKKYLIDLKEICICERKFTRIECPIGVFGALEKICR